MEVAVRALRQLTDGKIIAAAPVGAADRAGGCVEWPIPLSAPSHQKYLRLSDMVRTVRSDDR